MSRLRLLARNVSSGYLQVAVNSVYTLATVPLALHYLSDKEFGLWMLVSQLVGYLMLVDAGITAASARILIDHKDRPQDGVYGSVFKTGSVVHVIQGLLIAALALALGVMPGLFEVPPDLQRPFAWMLLGYGLSTAFAFSLRMFGTALNAHQRHDIVNYTMSASFVLNLAVLWAGFHFGLGVYSMLAAQMVTTLLVALAHVVTASWLRLIPPVGARGHFDPKVFRELFWFAHDLFVLNLGVQLVNASQIVIITRTLGLEAAAVWSVAMKGYMLAQQFVWRLWDYSANALSEMVVRAERPRLQQRFSELVVLTASISVFVGLGVAACNESLLAVWTRHRISWNPINDWLLPVLFVITSTTRLHAGLTVAEKTVRGMRYIYLLEGLSFVAAAFLFTPLGGLAAVLVCAAVMNVLWTGVYGVRRTAGTFHLSTAQVVSWLAPAGRLALLLTPVAVAAWWFTRPLPDAARLAINGLLVGSVGLLFLWRCGLTPGLRIEFKAKFQALGARWRR